MPKHNALFNVNRLVAESGKDVSPEASFLNDLDYTIRKMNAYVPYYYFKEITKEHNPEYFDATNGRVDVICLDELPKECDKKYFYDDIHAILHTNDQKYHVCLYSDGKPSKRYKPSTMHCIRQMYYQLTGAALDKQSEKSGDFYGICESGEDRHIRIQRAVSKMNEYGVDCEFIDVEDYIKQNNLNLIIEFKKDFETKVYDPVRNIIFLCDGLIRYKGKYYILEIKTESSFKWMNRNGYDDYHKFQACSYSLELGIDDVLFIYENRDVCTKKSFIVHVTDDDRAELLDRITRCDDCVKQHTPPPIEDFVTNKTCQYCDYKTVCKVDSRCNNESS